MLPNVIGRWGNTFKSIKLTTIFRYGTACLVRGSLQYASQVSAGWVAGNYQAGDGFGPSIADQLKMEPFAVVIKSDAVKTRYGGYGMVAVHTTKEGQHCASSLQRLIWCVSVQISTTGSGGACE